MPMQSRFLVALAALLLAGATSARAAEPPAVVADAIEDARKQCLGDRGKPGPNNGMVSVADLDGDGREDWILDYAKFDCKGQAPLFCGSGGCLLQIFMWQRADEWKVVYDNNVRTWTRLQIDGKPGIRFSLHGSECNKAGAEKCEKTYVFARRGLKQKR
jgi:hypothetical protein